MLNNVKSLGVSKVQDLTRAFKDLWSELKKVQTFDQIRIRPNSIFFDELICLPPIYASPKALHSEVSVQAAKNTEFGEIQDRRNFNL